MEKYCISVDWLQVYCLNNLSELPSEGVCNCKSFQVEKLGRVTPLWKECYVIKYQGLEAAEFCRFPRSSALDARGCTLKLHNRILYCARFIELLRDIMSFLNLTYVGVTRLDLCYDCNFLYGHRSVSDFLFQYFVHSPYCEGHIIRNGSRKVNIVGTRSSSGATSISAMRWGSKSSAVGVYCYNKSLELLEVHDKPWIRDSWASAGLIDDYQKEKWESLSDKQRKYHVQSGKSQNYIKSAVWRFEISIKSEGKDILNLDTGQLFRIDLNYLTTQQHIEKLFYVYANKYLDFRISTGQEQIKNYPKLQIFEKCEQSSLKPIKVNQCADTGRTEKIAARRLEKLAQTYSDLTTQDLHAINSAITFLYEIAGFKGSIIRQRRYDLYIEHLAAFEYKKQLELNYFEFLKYAHENKFQYAANTVSSYINSLNDCLEARYDLHS